MENSANNTALMVFALALGVTIMVGILFIHIYDPDLNDVMYTIRNVIIQVVDPWASQGSNVDIMPH